MIEADTRSQPDIEQPVHRQLAARVGQAHDNPVGTRALNEHRDVLDRANDAGVQDGRADTRRIRIDEADNVDAELVAALVQLAGKLDGRRARADEEEPFARRRVPAEPRKDQPPRDDQ